MAQFGKVLNEIVVDFRARFGFADYELFVPQVAPCHHVSICQRMRIGKHKEDALFPKYDCLTIQNVSLARDESNVQPMLSYRSNVINGRPFHAMKFHAWMFVVEPNNQFAEETGSE